MLSNYFMKKMDTYTDFDEVFKMAQEKSNKDKCEIYLCEKEKGLYQLEVDRIKAGSHYLTFKPIK